MRIAGVLFTDALVHGFESGRNRPVPGGIGGVITCMVTVGFTAYQAAGGCDGALVEFLDRDELQGEVDSHELRTGDAITLRVVDRGPGRLAAMID